MPIAFPLSMPTAPAIRNIRFRPLTTVAISRSPFTFTQQVQRGQGQAWSAEVELPPMKRAQAEAWNAFFLALNGPEGTFLLGDPDARTPRGVASGAPVVSGAGQTGQDLVTAGWAPSTPGVLLAGDYVQVGSGGAARLYKVLLDASSDAAGAATLSLWPRVRTAPPDATPLVLENAAGLFRLQEMPGWSADEASVYGISFTAIEAL